MTRQNYHRIQVEFVGPVINTAALCRCKVLLIQWDQIQHLAPAVAIRVGRLIAINTGFPAPIPIPNPASLCQRSVKPSPSHFVHIVAALLSDAMLASPTLHRASLVIGVTVQVRVRIGVPAAIHKKVRDCHVKIRLSNIIGVKTA